MKAKVTDKPVEVLTPEQTRRLLESADHEILPALAVAALPDSGPPRSLAWTGRK